MPRDIASIQYGTQSDYKHLYFSDANAALKVPITLQAGYGKLESGQAIAKNVSALTTGNKDMYVPYNLTVFDGTETSPGRAYLVADSGTVAYVYVTMDDSYKFSVGDDLIINSSGESVENLGAITAIDRTTEQHRAKITATSSVGNDMTTAETAYVCVEAGADNSNNYSDCAGILEKSVDTGTGSTAEGAIATMVVSNAVLYLGMCSGIDAASETDISATEYGNFLLIK